MPMYEDMVVRISTLVCMRGVIKSLVAFLD